MEQGQTAAGDQTFEQQVQHLPLKDGDVIVFRSHLRFSMDTLNRIAAIMRQASARVNGRVFMIALDSDATVELIPEEQMNLLGWQRIPGYGKPVSPQAAEQGGTSARSRGENHA